MSARPDLPPVEYLQTRRTARLAHLGPRNASRSLWICLHGYRQLAPWFLRHFRVLDDGTRRVIAPEALNRFYVGDPDGRHGTETRVGATWMTREARESEIDDYAHYLSVALEAQGGEERPLVALGFSQGAHTVSRWVLRERVAPRIVILWGEGLPHDVDEAALAALDTCWILVRGEADLSRDPRREERDHARLAEAGARCHVRTHAGGHRIAGGLLEELAEEFSV